ncbi:hypothetical protein F511_20813 [Dorcoceras hygrometricum]|uniref:Uncharacterized protein n=1 Tax=Dorcoceras hygrometricum TaxID=472368 RepID=A0A2Z7AZN2_9LAMI|nr:hypothetical protein F511_20813 [Dorcoceras hygrometricum]
MSLEDILMSILVEVPLPSVGVEITKITMGKEIKIPGVDERTWYLASLPQIQVDVKGKELLLEKDPVKGNPVKEQIVLTLEDIACLIDESYLAKDELVLTWAEVESTGMALNRKRCWIRTMLFVDGVWAVEPCADHWVKIPQPVVQNEVPRQRSYDDTLPPISLSTLLDESQTDILSKLHTIDKGLHDSLQQQEEAFKTLIQGARQEGRTIDDVQTLRFYEFRKGVLSNSVSVTADLMDIKKAVRELMLRWMLWAVMTKWGKVAADDLNHHLMIKMRQWQCQVVILLEALWKDLLVLIEKEKGAEGTEVDPTKEEDTRIE